jgi:aspartate kinase
MSVFVQKYGGSSVATPEMIRHVARRILSRKRAGDEVVAVVSAMGDTTDELIGMSAQVTDDPPEREMDMLLASGERISMALLSMAINGLGHPAISLTGGQAGIITDNIHRKARIRAVNAGRIREELAGGKVVIIAGFQGVTHRFEETTLGRGASDRTAVALAHALGAAECEIHTDVEGVYTADPRIVPDARKLPAISTDEMLELASAGARVLEPRCVEFAHKHGVRVHVRSTFTEAPGTLVVEEDTSMEQVLVRAVVHDLSEAKLTVRGVPDRPGIAAVLFGALAEREINVDIIVQSASRDDLADISFTVARDDLRKALECTGGLRESLGAREIIADEQIAKVSVVGVGMRSHAGVAAKVFCTLADQGINIQMISTSEIKITCVVASEDAEHATRVLHDAFDLGGAEADGAP